MEEKRLKSNFFSFADVWKYPKTLHFVTISISLTKIEVKGTSTVKREKRVMPDV